MDERLKGMHKVYVNNAQINKVLELHLHKVYSAQSKPAISSLVQPDELTLSSRVTEMQDVKQTVSNLPSIRTDLVNDIRAKIESGTYDLKSQDIADYLLRSSVENWGKA